MKYRVVSMVVLLGVLFVPPVLADDVSQVVMRIEVRSWCDREADGDADLCESFDFDYLPRDEWYTQVWFALVGSNDEVILNGACLPLKLPDDLEGTVWAINATGESDVQIQSRMTVEAFRELPPGFWVCEMIVRHKD